MCRPSGGLCALPAFLVVWSSCSFLVCYVVAVLRRDVDPLFPYISDTAADPPESCIFGLMTFISACAGIATIYARYKYVAKLSEDIATVSSCLNRSTCVLGLVSIIGMCIVATFQDSAVQSVHYVGAFLFFLFGILYTILQTVMSFRPYPIGPSVPVRWARAGIACIGVLALVPTIICGILAKRTRIYPEEEGYYLYLCSAVCEWITTFSFVLFFLTFINDFKLFTLRVTVSPCEYQPPASSEGQESPEER